MELHKQGYDRIRTAYPSAAADEAELLREETQSRNGQSRQAAGTAS
jgi:hypothetical protein